MKKERKIIVGAGLAGLIAACHFKDAQIFEAGVQKQQHNALLRFRDRSVSDVIDIPFKEVSVHKNVYHAGKLHGKCDIQMANQYSQKVTGALSGRSIWNLETVKRYVAPHNLYNQLVYRHKDRINWESPLLELERGNDTQVISTIPLPVMMKACGMKTESFGFAKSPIKVDRYLLPEGTDIYQTVYFPAVGSRLFRASITGGLLIVESMVGNPDVVFDWTTTPSQDLDTVKTAFSLFCDIMPLDSVDQQYGKIIELPRHQRESILYELTRDFNVFSLGRFATWRNILLDDVAKDIGVVSRLMDASSYGQRLVLADR